MGDVSYTCARCGMPSPVADVFVGAPAEPGPHTVCLRCHRRRRAPGGWWGWATLGVAVIPLAMSLVTIARENTWHYLWQEPGWYAAWLGTLYAEWLSALVSAAPLILAAALVSVLVHEAGHAVVARLVGMHITEVCVGHGPRVAAVTIGGTRFVLRLVPLGGHTMAFPTSGSSRGRRALMVAAGPFMDAAVLAAVLVAGMPGSFGRMLALVTAVALAENLFPYGRARDGVHLRQLLTGGSTDPAAGGEQPPGARQRYVEAAEAHRDGRIDEARRLCEEALLEYPGDTAIAALLAGTLLEQGDALTARSRLQELLESDLPDVRRAVTLANLAVADLLLDERGLLAEALHASSEALALVPDEPVLRGIRGYALISAGHIEEGLMLATEALADLPSSDGNRAGVLAVQTIGHARRGRLREAAASLDHARRIRPTDPLVERARDELDRCRRVVEESAGRALSS